MTMAGPSVSLEREVGGPPDRIWTAWTQPEELARWWWPEGLHTVYRVDLRNGGRYHFRSEVPPGGLGLSGTFLDIEPGKRLVYSWRWDGDDAESTVGVDFGASGRGTVIRVRHDGLRTDEERENHVTGWTNCLDRLAALFPPQPEAGSGRHDSNR